MSSFKELTRSRNLHDGCQPGGRRIPRRRAPFGAERSGVPPCDQYREVSSPRRQMVAEGGHVLPTRLTVFNRIRGTSTEVRFDHLRVNPEIDDRLFTVTMLERDRDLPIFND